MAKKVNKEEAYIIGAAQKRFRDEYQKKKRNKKIKSTILWTLGIILLGFIVFNVGFKVTEYHGTGMSATCKDGDIIVTNRLSYLLSDPVRGEVVTIDQDGKSVVKRIIGLPGDQIDYENGDVYINGQRCIEAYVSTATSSDVAHMMVPQGTYYVLNDDRDDTSDSRTADITDSSIQGAKIAVIHVPDIVKTNQAYQSVRNICIQGASAMSQAENAVKSIIER